MSGTNEQFRAGLAGRIKEDRELAEQLVQHAPPAGWTWPDPRALTD